MPSELIVSGHQAPASRAAPLTEPFVFLVNPWEHSEPGGYLPPPSDCLGLNYIAAVLREAGYPLASFDGYVEPSAPEPIVDRIVRALEGHQHDHGRRPQLVLGFSFMCPTQLPHAEHIVRRLGERGWGAEHVMAGGQFAATSCHAFLHGYPTTFDSVVYGEGEETARDLLAALAGGRDWRQVPGVASRTAEGVQLVERDNPDVRALPRPARDSLPALLGRDGVVNLDTSRGCESNCTFCMSREILRSTPSRQRWRSRHAVEVVDEIEALVARGARRFNFTDENTIGNRSHRGRLIEMADEIRARNLDIEFNAYVRAQDVDPELLTTLQRAGLASVFVGIESFWPQTLRLLNKRVSEQTNLEAIRAVRSVSGLRLHFGLMTFHPWVSLAELRHNLRRMGDEVLGVPLTGPEMLKRLQQVMLIYRGTPSYQLAKRDGLLGQASRFDQGVCSYRLPEQPRQVLRFINRTLTPLMRPHHELFLLTQAPASERNEALVRRGHEVSTEIDRFLLDVVDGFAAALQAGATDAELEDRRRRAEARVAAWVQALERLVDRQQGARGPGLVDQPLDAFLEPVYAQR